MFNPIYALYLALKAGWGVADQVYIFLRTPQSDETHLDRFTISYTLEFEDDED